jgi:hypothetical protein
MDGRERMGFVRHFFWGLLMLVIAYFFLTAYRDYRDNYQVDLFTELNYPYDGGTVQLAIDKGREKSFAYDGNTEFIGSGGEKVSPEAVSSSLVHVIWKHDGDRKVASRITEISGKRANDVLARDQQITAQSETLGMVRSVNDHKTIITKAELIVAFGVLVPLALLFLIRNNYIGLIGTYIIMLSGVFLLGGSTWALQNGTINGFWWMTLVGLGAYLAYVPYGSVLFDRLMAQTHVIGTAVFAIYIMDALGYTGSVAVQVYCDIFYPDTGSGGDSRLAFFIDFSYLMAAVGLLLFIGSCLYFLAKGRTATKPAGP